MKEFFSVMCYILFHLPVYFLEGNSCISNLNFVCFVHASVDCIYVVQSSWNAVRARVKCRHTFFLTEFSLSILIKYNIHCVTNMAFEGGLDAAESEEPICRIGIIADVSLGIMCVCIHAVLCC